MVNPRLVTLAEKLGNEVSPRQEALDSKPDPVTEPKVLNTREYIVLENIACRDSNGKPFEQYPQLFVRKDVERGVNQRQINHTPFDWVQYFEDKGLFLPSFALSCNILSALYNKRGDPETNKVLMQYKDYGPGYGWHAQNTVVDWGANKIIHYPSQDSQRNNINTKRPTKELLFARKQIKEMALEEALRNKDFRAYIQNLTGLTDTETLVGIRKYFGKPAKVWTSLGKDMCAAWLGCYDYGFILDTYGNLGYDNAARGVRAEKLRGV